ncbi:hypothetical protein BC829DRAFT_413313 [Chytridium lagenaria]|nr:hypothetical protein BC829DRAFT_413313 [Chytridium lagenaria]
MEWPASNNSNETQPLLATQEERKKSLRRRYIPLVVVGIVAVVVAGTVVVGQRERFPGLFPGGKEDGGEADGVFGWKKCVDLNDDRFSCGTLQVPYDYQNLSVGTFSLAVARYRANPSLTTTNRISIVLNPGGPGGSGVSMLKSSGPMIHNLVSQSDSTSPIIDIVSFDPRGIGASNPVLCFDSSFAHTAFEKGFNGVGVPGYLGSHTSLEGFAAYQKARGESCRLHDGRKGKEFLKYVSTALTARDMDLVREGLGEDVLNYWGFSYGTFLGAVYVNMFPDRVGRVIIDGVVNPVDFTTTKSDMMAGSVLHVEEIINEFGDLCQSAGPLRCPLSTLSSKNETVTALIHKSLARLAAYPLAVHNLPVPTVVNAETLGNLLLQASYSPAAWPRVAQAIAALHPNIGTRTSPHPPEADAKPLALLTGSAMMEKDAEEGICHLPVDTSGAEGFPAVYCSDSKDEREIPLEEWEEWAKRVEGVSPTAGRLFFFKTVFACKYWPSRPVERFTGPWNNKLKNKILIIGNTLDPVTPLESARIVETLMEGNGVLLTQQLLAIAPPPNPVSAPSTSSRIISIKVFSQPPGTVCGKRFTGVPASRWGEDDGDGGVGEGWEGA